MAWSRTQGCATSLGDDIAIDIDAADEINTRIRPGKIIERFRRHGNFGLVFLVGVQSNQFPRALDIARPLRAAGIPVAIGGFHVSGCLAMLDGMQADLQAALDLGITLFAGELEGRCDALLRDAANGTLKPIYNFLNDLPALEAMPPPILPKRYLKRTYNLMTSFDAGRGCPFECSFCTIINVQGRKSRKRSPDDIERLIRLNLAQGVSWFFITDDNFARNKDWEAIFDRIIAVRREVEGTDRDLKIIIQVDTLCHKNPDFIAKAKLAGVRRVFIGLETHQSRQPGGREEAPEQDHRISPDAARLEDTPASSPMRATSWAFRTTRPKASPKTSRSSRRSCRSTSSSSSASPRCRARRITRSCGSAASRWTPT